MIDGLWKFLVDGKYFVEKIIEQVNTSSIYGRDAMSAVDHDYTGMHFIDNSLVYLLKSNNISCLLANHRFTELSSTN